MHEAKAGKMKQIVDSFNEVIAQMVMEFLTPEMAELLNEPFNQENKLNLEQM